MRKLSALLAPLAVIVSLAIPAATSADTATTSLPGNTPSWLGQAKDLGPADPGQTVGITVWLRYQHENQLDQAAQAVSTKGNASYHTFQSAAQVMATYAPTTGTVNGVSNWLQAKGLSIVSTAPNNISIDAQGTIGNIEKAFHVQIDTFSYQGQTYFSNTTDPSVDNGNAANGQIAAVDGLNNAGGYAPTLATLPTDTTGGSTPARYAPLCGSPSDSATIPVQGQGNVKVNGLLTCGNGASQIQKAYGLDKVCSYTTSGVSGLCGQGQSIVIVDAFGSPTLQQDVNKYDQVNSLPPLTVGQNLTVVTEPGITANKPANPHWGDPRSWQTEVTLDVENAHAVAPGANIVLMVAPNNGNALEEADNWAVVHHYGNVVSNSWSNFEILLTPARLNRDERIFETAALEGIGVDFSSGDWGDNSPLFGVKTATFPSTSPFVTSLGGTSLFNGSSNPYLGETGWGTEIQRQYKCAASTTDSTGLSTCTSYTPSLANLGFQYGAGGGVSTFFAAPAWQQAAGVSDTARVEPDVSMLADPETGSVIYVTDLQAGATSPIPEQYGGTSLSCPLFTALMALVNQQRAAAGKDPVGLVAPFLYGNTVYGTSALHDVSGVPSFAANGLHYRGTASGSIYSVYFNRDTSLAAGSGWDDATGVGSPNGQSFINAMANQ